MANNKIILNIPHSSINGIFDKEIGKWPRNAFFVNTCVKEHTDWFTDMLFHTDDNAIKEIIFPYSRFVCDVERLEDDELNRIGQGIVYTEYNGYKRGALSEEEYAKIVQLREEYLIRLKSHITENSILIDCHSFSNRTMEDTPDICIGYNNDESYSGLIVNEIANNFEKSGYSVKFNFPYTNSLYPKMPFAYKSVMIEVNKRIYMNEDTITLNTNPRQWMRWYGCLARIYERLKEISLSIE